MQLARRASGDDAARMSGLAYFAAGHGADAAAAFDKVAPKSADDWNDLAAAEIAAAADDEERWISALVAADRALALESGLAEAAYNRTIILDHFGLTRLTAPKWPSGGTAAWAEEAQRRTRKASAAVSRATTVIEHATAAELPGLIRKYPQDARAVGEGIFLSAWASAAAPADAKRHLDRARLTGRILQSEFGETLLADAVAAIDVAGARLPRLRAGHLSYRAGRQALSRDDDDTAEAERKLDEARRALVAGGSPLAMMAEEYLATAYLKQNRTAEALALLTRLREQTRPGYKTLLARIQHDLALCEAQRGRWSASLAAAGQSVAIWTSLGDRANAAAAEAIVSEDYDFLGQRELAWKHGLSALRNACSAKHVRHARSALAALTRTEMRAGRWETARSVARLEEGVAGVGKNDRPDTGLLLRIATIEARAGNAQAAAEAVEKAGRAAARLKHREISTKLRADVDAVAGAIARRRDPRVAVERLSSAIAYSTRAARRLMLPELYLERARAHIALNALNEAEQDLDEGIRELERQREHVDDAQLRPGLFDSSAELFHDAVSLQLRSSRNPARVFSYIERGRARALLEQLGEHRAPPALEDVQRHLGSGAAIVEYLSLTDRLVAVVIRSRTTSIETVDVSSACLRAALTDSARLYDLLIRPIAGQLRDVSAVTFIPDDVMQRVAFAALIDRDTRSFLIERHTVSTAPSAGVALVTTRRTPRGAPASVLVVANPAIPHDAFPSLPSLAGSEREASAVARHYRRSRVLRRADATAERFVALAPTYAVVHFAGHAVVRHREPGASALVCATSPRMHGALTLRQIAAMRFRETRVVVLAACSTMTGRNAAIEGVPSLARAFVVAGVPAVVGTLWDIDDREAMPLMQTLHEQLATGATAADALRAAQLAAIREGRAVEQWAAFALTGTAS